MKCRYCGGNGPIFVHVFSVEGHCRGRECVKSCPDCQYIYKKMESPYYAAHISPSMEDGFRRRMDADSSVMRDTGFRHENAWIGLAGEYTFEKWLKELGVKGYKYHDSPGKKLLLDFTVKGRKIDVKTKSIDRYPPPIYRVDYNERQLQSNKTVDTLVFAGYAKIHRAVYLTCWNTKEDFLKVGHFLNVGEFMVTPEGRPYKVSRPMRIADIRDNRTIKELEKEVRG